MIAQSSYSPWGALPLPDRPVAKPADQSSNQLVTPLLIQTLAQKGPNDHGKVAHEPGAPHVLR